MLSTYAGVAKGKHCCFMLLLKLQSVPEQTTGLNRIESWRVEQLIELRVLLMEGSSSQEVVSTRPSCLSHPIAVFPWKISSDHDKENIMHSEIKMK